MSVLARSAATRHPANSPAAPQPRSDELPVTRFARGIGLDSTPSRELAESERTSQYQRQIYRKWQPGDVYAPHDLSGAEQKKWKQGRKRPQQDAFDVLGVNPVLEYKVRRPNRIEAWKAVDNLDRTSP